MLLLNKAWGYIVAVGVAILAIIAALMGAKQSGKREEREAETEKALDQAKESNAIDKSVRADTDAALDDKLRKYTRD